MEMNDQVLQHIMNVQTQMLQHMERLQLEQLQQQSNRVSTDPTVFNTMPADPTFPNGGISSDPVNMQNPTAVFSTPLSDAIASPVTPPQVNMNVIPGTLTMSNPGIPTMSVKDPTEYGTYSAGPLPDGSRLRDQADVTLRNFVSNSIEQIRSYDAMNHSKESTAQFITSQTQGVQQQMADMLGGALGGATAVGTMFIPGGLLPSLALGTGVALGVGGVSSAISNEVRESLGYQDVLQRESYRFINAFESQNEMGGMGYSLEERQDLSRFLRELAPENFLNDQEMTQILQGASQNNLLRSVRDVQSFKDKFTDIVGAVREITVALDATVEEATEFMGELERRGITTRDTPYVAAQARVTGSLLGMSATDASQLLFNTSDAVTAGTMIDPSLVMRSTAQNVFAATNLQDWAATNDPELYQGLKNAGGGSAVGPQFEINARQYITSAEGTNRLLGYFASGFELGEEGNFAVNQAAMRDLLSGNLDSNEMLRRSRQFMNSLDSGQRNLLATTAGELFSGQADTIDITGFIGQNARIMQEAAERSGTSINMQQALMQSGIASDYAQASIYEGMIRANEDPVARRMLAAQTMREQMDSAAIADSPGLGTRMRFFWERNFNNVVGNFAQDITDETGQFLQDYQRFITSIDDRSLVRGEFAPFTLEGSNQSFSDAASLLRESSEFNLEHFQGRYDTATENGWDRVALTDDIARANRGLETAQMLDQLAEQDNVRQELFSQGSFEVTLGNINQGNIRASELANLQQQMDSGDLSVQERWRAGMAINAAQGDYDGLWGTIRYGAARTALGTMNLGASLAERGDVTRGPFSTSGIASDDISDDLLSDIEEEGESLRDDTIAARTNLNTLFTDTELKNLDPETQDQLEQLILGGNESEVKAITQNKKAHELAATYNALNTREENYKINMGVVTNMTAETTAWAQSTRQLEEFFQVSGGYTDEETDALLGDLLDLGKDTIEDIQEGNLKDPSEMKDARDKLAKAYNEIFSSQNQYNASAMAQYLVDNTELTMDDLTVDGSNRIDTGALQSGVVEYLSLNHRNAPEVKNPDEEGGVDAGEAKEAASAHEEAMYSYIEALQREREALVAARNNEPLPTRNTTSNQSR